VAPSNISEVINVNKTYNIVGNVKDKRIRVISSEGIHSPKKLRNSSNMGFYMNHKLAT
jgi:hypothetical protein